MEEKRREVINRQLYSSTDGEYCGSTQQFVHTDCDGKGEGKGVERERTEIFFKKTLSHSKYGRTFAQGACVPTSILWQSALSLGFPPTLPLLPCWFLQTPPPAFLWPMGHSCKLSPRDFNPAEGLPSRVTTAHRL